MKDFWVPNKFTLFKILSCIYEYNKMNEINENTLNQLFDNFQQERQKIILEIKNDKEMKNEKYLNQKLSTIETIIKNLLKFRNIQLKQQQKFNND